MGSPGRPPRYNVRLQIWLQPDVKEALLAEAKERKITAGDLITEALRSRVRIIRRDRG